MKYRIAKEPHEILNALYHSNPSFIYDGNQRTGFTTSSYIETYDTNGCLEKQEQQKIDRMWRT